MLLRVTRQTPQLLKHVSRRPGMLPSTALFSSIVKELESIDNETEILELMSQSPLGDDRADCNKFFEITDEQFPASFPDGVETGFDMLFARLGTKRLMVRDVAQQLINLLKKEGQVNIEDDVVDESNSEKSDIADAPLVVLSATGKNQPTEGVGKTCTLMHAIHWARSSGWVVLQIDAREVMTGGLWIQPSELTEDDLTVDENTVVSEFDQPQVAMGILENLLSCHGEVLASMQHQGSNLKELAEEGVAHENAATSNLVQIMQQLKHQTDVPVMVAIDGFNLLFEETEFYYRNKQIKADEFPLVREIRGLTICGTSILPGHSFPARGLVIGCESNKYPRSRKLDYYQHAGDALWKQKVKRIPISNMSLEEADHFIEFFQKSNILTSTDSNQRCQFVPDNISHFLYFYSLPIVVVV